MEQFAKFLGNIDKLIESSTDGKKEDYVHPTLKNVGNVTIVVIREAIAPVIFRNSEPEITDIEFNGEAYIRAVPNKFKYPERGRGLQILRAYGVGGKLPQNKTVLHKKDKPSDAFDLNTLVFGDSANHDNRILPVKAAVNYSDGLSILPKHLCVDESFHNRAMEDGTLFDAQSKKNSDNLFTRHFIMPGTLMVQVLSTRGRVLPPEAMDHLLLSMGIAGSYGGQTSITGVNIKTHLAGVYGSSFERSLASPYEIVKTMGSKVDKTDCNSVIKSIHDMMEKNHEISMGAKKIQEYQTKLIHAFESEDKALEKKYIHAAQKTAELFDNWFGTGKKK